MVLYDLDPSTNKPETNLIHDYTVVTFAIKLGIIQ